MSAAARVTVYRAGYGGIGEAVERAMEDFALPVAGKSVLLKPNVLGPISQERPVCTHPSLVRAAVEAVRRRGAARIMVGDNSGMRAYGSNEHAARVSGILDAADGHWVNLGASPVATALRCEVAARLAFSREVLQADLVIGLPKMKTHVGTGVTGAVKNTYGHLVGGEKVRLHREARGPEAFARAAIDVYQVRPPDLSILDAVVAMEGQGPSGGKPREVGRVLASTNAVALDTVMAAMMGLEARRVPMLRVAGERGLGPVDLGDIQIDGPFETVPDFKVPRISMGLASLATRAISYLVVTRPEVRRKKCVKCGSCAEACPVEAITMTDEGPVIAYSKCISCFCCHEMCRYEAMDVTRRMRFLQGVDGPW